MNKKKLMMSVMLTFTLCFSLMGNVSATKLTDYRWPVQDTKARVTSRYGWRTHPVTGVKKFHHGVDLIADTNYILATKAGKVISSTYNSSAGNYITIEHADKYHSIYMHLAKKYVKVGDTVKKGQIIGYMGTTGLSTGVHLHFQLEKPKNYESVNVNTNKVAYTFSKNHTHVYVYKYSAHTKHPHKLYAHCVCGAKILTDKYGVNTGCDSCKPKITTKNNTKFKANTATIKWGKVQNADSYSYNIYKVDRQYAGSFSTEYKTVKGTSATIKNLLPGKYKVHVKARNSASGTAGSNGKEINIQVDNNSYAPTAAVEYNGKLYGLFDVSTSWTYANQICTSMNAKLAVLDTKEKNTAVTNLIKQKGKKNFYFIGASDSVKKKKFAWITGKSLTYTNWAKGQPSYGSSTINYKRQGYLSIDKSKSYKWNDLADINPAEKTYKTANKGFVAEAVPPAKPQATTITSVKNLQNAAVEVKYNAVKGANRYYVYYSLKKDTGYIKSGYSTTTTYTINGLSPNKQYYIKIKPVCVVWGVHYIGTISKDANILTKYKAPESFALKKINKTTIEISYKKVSGASGYSIYQSTSQNGKYIKIKNTTSLKYNNTKLKAGNTYYYKVRAYKIIDDKKVYGMYTTIKSKKL